MTRRVPSGSTLADRLAYYSVRTEAGCLVWTGSKDGRLGYGKLRWNGPMRYAHRLAWELANGPVPEGLVLRHTCDNPPCIEITHLLLGTQTDNVADCFARGRQSERSGEANNSARLTWTAVRLIREARSTGAGLKEIAERFGISMSQAHNITAHKQWKESAA